MEILRAMSYAIHHGEGIIKVVGEVGSGKTMLSRMLATEIGNEVELVYLLDPGLAANDVHRAIAQELGIDIRQQTDRISIIQALHHKLLERYADKKHVVVFIDEAQNMPLETLEEIRLLSNLETNTRKLLQIVLFGQPELDKKLATTEARQLRERITENFHLPLLSAEQTGQYLSHRLSSAGHSSSKSLFNWATTRFIANASQGSLRKINTIADKSLLSAYATNSKSIEKRHVRAAIKDSQLRQPPLSNWQLFVATLATLFTLPTVAMALLAPGTIAPIDSVTEKPALSSHQIVIKPKKITSKAPKKSSETTRAIDTQHTTEVTEEDIAIVVEPLNKPIENDTLQSNTGISRWINANNARFTIQLFSARKNNKASIDTFLQRNTEHLVSDDVRILPTHYSVENRIEVLYGNFITKKEAYAAIAALPENISRHQPYLRSISRIAPIVAKN